MIESKINHPHASASTTWVSSPMVATLHAMHYHLQCHTRHRELISVPRASLKDILTIP